MKRILLIATVLLFIFGCSNDEKSVANSNDNISLEQQIADVLKEHDFSSPDNIVDYEIKDKFIYVFSYSMPTGLSVAILKHTPNSIEWIMSGDPFQNTSFAHKEEETPIITVVQPDDSNVKDVKVMGEHAKLIKRTRVLTEDYSKEIKFWVHFSEMTEENLENTPSTKVELIR